MEDEFSVKKYKNLRSLHYEKYSIRINIEIMLYYNAFKLIYAKTIFKKLNK